MAAVEALSYGIKGVFLAGDLLSYEELWNNVSFIVVMYYNLHNVTDYYTGQKVLKLTVMVELGAPLLIWWTIKLAPAYGQPQNETNWVRPEGWFWKVSLPYQ